ncbi:aspartic-type endopeptidase activity protein [Homalodisca vitripennis]|nr:aspartic-type endopeptidase activity protein [Homalodisca vitripennis]
MAEARGLTIIPWRFRGEAAALKWYENMEGTMGDCLTWAQIRDGLKETFKGIAWEEQVEYRLRMRMQGEMEPVEAYVQDVLNLCNKVDNDMLERSKIKYVLRGLKPLKHPANGEAREPTAVEGEREDPTRD